MDPLQAPKSKFPIPLRWLVPGGLLVLFIVYFSLTPVSIELMAAPVFTLTPRQGYFVRKAGHVIAYAALMFWFGSRYEAFTTRRMIALGLVASGIVLESVQGLLGYRHFRFSDMAINAAGVALGWALVSLRTQNFLRKFFRR